MEKHLTGHIYYRSPYESDDNCGTCDGANCDRCNVVYTVNGVNSTFSDPGKAKAAEDAEKSLINLNHYGAQYFIKDDKLYASVWPVDSNGYVEVQCNEESARYKSKFDEVKQCHDRYDECNCTDKSEVKDGSPCSKFGCNDMKCYNKMKRGAITAKVVYL